MGFGAGPYPQIGALLYLFHMFTPRIHPKFFGVLGFNLSEKVFTYFFIFQLVFSGGSSTIIPTMCGFLAGMLSISPKTLFGRYDLTFPAFIHVACGVVGRALGLDSLYPCPIVAPRLRGAGSGSAGSASASRLAPGNSGIPIQQPLVVPQPSEAL